MSYGQGEKVTTLDSENEVSIVAQLEQNTMIFSEKAVHNPCSLTRSNSWFSFPTSFSCDLYSGLLNLAPNKYS